MKGFNRTLLCAMQMERCMSNNGLLLVVCIEVGGKNFEIYKN